MGRTRDRASAAGLLPRMEARPWSDGTKVTYRYHPVGGKPINLGTDKAAALRKVLDLNGQAPADEKGTLRWVWAKFKESPRWKKLSDGTRADYEGAWKQIDERLGHMHMGEITTFVVAQYVHIERAESPRRADIEKSLLSRLFGHGIKLGVCAINATIGVEPHGSEPRTEAPDPALLERFLGWLAKQTEQRQVIGMAAEYASLAGNRQVEFLPLSWPQVDRAAGEIRVFRAKQRGKKRERIVEVIQITPAMEALLDRLQAVQKERGKDCLYVFPTRDNNAYTARGFKTLWQRSVMKAIEDKVLTAEDRFTFHDLRAYYATVHKQVHGALPDMHTNPATTAKVYDRNREVRRRAL
ncbi:MAG: integrase [Variovorax paradoxus]|nr:MAG: integrase [Variovorax paradoxus]PZQ03138.1 MAG: integrase [Variovorax paradoxus]